MPMSGVRCIAFDFDGTLVQSNALKRESYYDVARELGDVTHVVDAVLAEVTGDRREVLGEIVRRAKHAGLLPSGSDMGVWVARLVDAYTARCEELVARCPEVPGAGDALGALKHRGYALYVNSATPAVALERIVGLRGLDVFFSAVFGSEGGKLGNLERILELEKVGARGLVFVGDQQADSDAAEAIGCHFIAIENDLSLFARRPERPLADLTSLLRVVLALDGNQEPSGAGA
jgi:phosphoglycolate phosphatase-like HAD superfamily hydrolase